MSKTNVSTHYDAHGDSEYACGGDDDCEGVESTPDCLDGLSHHWTSRGCGGCDSNPGVWSIGGTSYQFERRCVLCGTREIEVHHGSQRNPGECDERRYEDGEVDESEATAERRRQRRNRLARLRVARRLVISDVTRHPVEAVATIPMPTADMYTMVRVSLGSRCWVVRLYADGAATVRDACDPQQHETRASGLRSSIVRAAWKAATSR